MEGSLPVIERFKTAWSGVDRLGRRAYVSPISSTEFLAYGVHEPSGRLLFAVVGSLKNDLWVFAKQMQSDGVKVTLCYGPKVANDDNGESVRSCIALKEAWDAGPIGDQINDPTTKGP